jgi:hypothetical protein
LFFKDEDVEPSPGQQQRRNKSVVSGADDDDIGG